MLGKDTKSQSHFWIIRFEGSEFGPFSPAEALEILQSGSLKGKVFAKRNGLKQWYPAGSAIRMLNNPDGFNDHTQEYVSHERRDQWEKRCAIIATVSVEENGKLQTLGVCVDISMSGIQVQNALKTSLQHFTVGQVVQLVVHFVSMPSIHKLNMVSTVIWVSEAQDKIGFKFNQPVQDRSIKLFLEEKTSVT